MPLTHFRISNLFVMICFLDYMHLTKVHTYSEQMSLTQFKKLALGLVGIRFQKRVCTSFVIISLSFFYASAAKNAVDAMIARTVFLFLFSPQIYCVIKAQLISKYLFGVFTFFQKTKEKSNYLNSQYF